MTRSVNTHWIRRECWPLKAGRNENNFKTYIWEGEFTYFSFGSERSLCTEGQFPRTLNFWRRGFSTFLTFDFRKILVTWYVNCKQRAQVCKWKKKNKGRGARERRRWSFPSSHKLSAHSPWFHTDWHWQTQASHFYLMTINFITCS